MTTDIRNGFLAALAAYLIWGLLPLYFKWLGHIAPADMLAQRILWSVPTGILLLSVARRWSDFKGALQPRHLRWLLLSGLFIGGNWFLYIWAVGQGRVMEASLGYYLNPLVNVALGSIFLSESLRRAQWVAVGLACGGVAIMAQALGQLPWVSLVLCFSFSFYGLIRKQVPVDGRAGFLVEAAVLLPLAMGWTVFQLSQPGTAPFGDGGWNVLALAISGPLTAVPLILFAVAAKRLMLATIGMMQYIAPTLQFLVAILYGEAFSMTHALAFTFIWSALILFTIDGILGNRRAQQPPRAA
ncbi:MAG: EamA family transporter RarD [Pseudomonadota bacterium]